jgi:hypothetical protein
MSWKKFTGYYVYTYLDENLNPYYVGMGCKNRMIAKHLYVTVPSFDKIVVEDNLTQEQAWNREIELIAHYGREHLGTGPLKNLTEGGPTQKSGWAQSDQTKKKISQGNRGKVRTLEQRQNYSKPKTLEHSEKIRNANLGRKNDGRYEKIGKTMSLKRWYNNGVTTKMFVPGMEEPEFYPGRALKENTYVLA